MRIIRRNDGQLIRRKNLAGVTYELVVVPEGASYETFLWRISWSEVDDNAALWPFPGVDRTLVLLDGSGAALDFGDGTVVLGTASSPLCFPGEAPVVAWLNAGPVSELNVMTRRGRATHQVRLLDVPGRPLPADCTAVVCRDGRITLDGAALDPGDCAVLQAEGHDGVVLGGSGRLVAVSIEIMDPPDTSVDHLERLRRATGGSQGDPGGVGHA